MKCTDIPAMPAQACEPGPTTPLQDLEMKVYRAKRELDETEWFDSKLRERRRKYIKLQRSLDKLIQQYLNQ
jgi:hypothetical protein